MAPSGLAPAGDAARGTWFALAIVLPALVAWLMLWDAGLLLSTVPYFATLLACWLFAQGSRQPLGARGAFTVAVISVVTAAISIGLTFLLSTAHQYLGGESPSMLFAVGELVDERFLSWLNLVYLPSETARLLWVPSVTYALALTGLGTGLGLWTALGRTLRPASQVAFALGGIGFFALSLLANSQHASSLTAPEAPAWQVGDCILGASEQYLERELPRLPAADCTDLHDAEVFYTVDLDGGEEYPSSDWFAEQVSVTCFPQLDEYLGPQYRDREWFVFIHYPGAVEWAVGDRGASCAVESVGEARYQSVRAQAETAQ